MTFEEEVDVILRSLAACVVSNVSPEEEAVIRAYDNWFYTIRYPTRLGAKGKVRRINTLLDAVVSMRQAQQGAGDASN